MTDNSFAKIARQNLRAASEGFQTAYGRIDTARQALAAPSGPFKRFGESVKNTSTHPAKEAITTAQQTQQHALAQNGEALGILAAIAGNSTRNEHAQQAQAAGQHAAGLLSGEIQAEGTTLPHALAAVAVDIDIIQENLQMLQQLVPEFLRRLDVASDAMDSLAARNGTFSLLGKAMETYVVRIGELYGPQD